MFKDTMLSINQPCVPSKVVTTTKDALDYAKEIGYPVIVRPAFTLGGTGGGIANDEAELDEIVRLVGVDALSWKDRLTLEVARSIREDYLHQNAFDEVDTYTSLNKQYRMLSLILDYQAKGQVALEKGADLSQVTGLAVRERIGRAKYIPEDELAQFDKIESELSDQMAQLGEGGV